jgi:RHS repeat-associated protein
MKKYYYAGGARVAMRTGSTLSFLLTDHLGSTAITASSSGAKSAELRYKAWGETRYTEGVAPTDFRYTGQRFESLLGLHDYGARWYDSALGRWLQPDTIVPLESQGVQAWDRYAYVNNNPVRYNDPNGHCLILCTALIGAAVGAIVGAVGYTAYTAISGTEFNTGHMLLAAGGGAAAGALIGTGVGIAAGMSSAAATTAAVTGGGAATTATTTVLNATRQGAQVASPALARTLGQAGETISGILKNTQRINSLTGTAQYHIPDQLLKSQRLISEVKNVAQLSLTNQIKDYSAFAQQEVYTFELWVRETTKLSQPLQKLIDNGQIILKHLEPK